MKAIRFNHVYHSWAFACLMCGFSLMGSAVLADSPTDGADESAAAVVAEAEASEPTAHANWVTSMEQAQELARDKRKTILMDFTGSDWCGWCIKLSEEVFDTPEFKEWADQHLVLVELDFPNDQSKITPEIKAHNDQWLKKLQVAGFPTVYLTDHEGLPFAKTAHGMAWR